MVETRGLSLDQDLQPLIPFSLSESLLTGKDKIRLFLFLIELNWVIITLASSADDKDKTCPLIIVTYCYFLLEREKKTVLSNIDISSHLSILKRSFLISFSSIL
jgi:hypothetical protein